MDTIQVHQLKNTIAHEAQERRDHAQCHMENTVSLPRKVLVRPSSAHTWTAIV